MSSNSNLHNAVRLGLGIGAGALAAGFAPSALAQGADQEVIEEIVTTGSRIKRADLDSASPVTVLNRDQILNTGVTDVGNIIQKMPSMSGSPIGTTTNNGGNGSVLIDLRGMGTDRTLTLVNGKRVVDGGDYQTIPSVMIERVEILKDGASAVYGADAVAGVVNIITRRDFEGIEISAQTADFFDMDSGEQQSISLIAGKVFDGGNIVFGAEYVDQEQAFQSDAPWDFFQDSYYIYPGGCENQLTAPYDGTPTGGCYVAGSSRVPQSRLPFFAARDINDNGTPSDTTDDFPNPGDYPGNGLFHIGTANPTPYGVGAMTPGAAPAYNYAPVNYIQTPYQRTNMFVEGHFELTDNVRFNTEVRGNKRTSEQILAPLPYTGGDPYYNGFFTNPVTNVTTAFEGISQDNYYLREAVDAYNAANGTSLSYDPVIQPRRRMIETSRRFEQDITQLQWVAGLEGTLANDMDWDVSYSGGYRNRVDQDFGQFSGVRLFNALGPSADLNNDGQPECYADRNDPATLIVGCVPLNLFGGGEVNAAGQPTTTSLTQDMVNYVKLDTVDTYVERQETLAASISGTALELPGGVLGWAAGVSYWRQEYAYTPDSAKTIGAVTGNVGAGTDGTLTNNSVFVEVFAPVWDNGTQSLDLKGGLRYDGWSAFDGDTTWQFGVELQALDSLKLRATAGSVFRAPTIDDLFGGTIDDFPTYSDPCIPTGGAALPAKCAQVGVQLDTQVLARVGGNPNLIPETGDTFTAGFVWTPDFAQGDLSVTADYWAIDLEDGLSSFGVQFILDDCYLRGNDTSCALITRNADYSINNIVDGTLNVAEQGATGVDFEGRYNLDSDIGQWEFSLLWSHLLERTKTPFAGAAEQEIGGTYTDRTAEDGGAYPDNKINYSVQWMRNNMSISYLGEFVGEMDTLDAFGVGYAYVIDSQLYHDIVGTYNIESTGTTISAGVTNITDEAPPFIDVGFNAKTDVSAYRLFGMGYYLRVTQNFD